MHSIINFKLWKKCIKRFTKKKLKQESCSTCTHVQKSAPVPEIESACKKSSFEQLSLYSADSLEEKRFFFRKYGSIKSYNNQFKRNSPSSESVTTNSMTSDISEDSLQRRSLSGDSLCMQMKEHMKNIYDYTESRKMRSGFSNKILLSKCQISDRSQLVRYSYPLENIYKRRGQNFYIEDQLDSCKNKLSNYEAQLSQCEALSIDSLEDTLTGRLNSFKKQFISEDSLNDKKEEYLNKFNNVYRKKSISDSILHETRYFQHPLDNGDSIILNTILLNEIKKKHNLENILLKSSTEKHSLTSLFELPFVENYESEDEKLSIDSLSIPQHEVLENKRCGISEVYLKRNPSSSPSTSSYKTVDSSKLNSSQKIKMHQSYHQKLETNQCYHFAMDNKKCNLNSQDFQVYSTNVSYHYSSNHPRDSEKEDSISIDSLCDSLN